MGDTQYDVSAKMKSLFEEKQKQRLAAKEYYQNYLYNPHRPQNDGNPFDPALQRFSAMSMYHIEYFRPSGSHIVKFLLYLSPFALGSLYVINYKKKEEKLLRSGVVKYSDRNFKLMY